MYAPCGVRLNFSAFGRRFHGHLRCIPFGDEERMKIGGCVKRKAERVTFMRFYLSPECTSPGEK